MAKLWRVVVVGAGFGGIETALKLADEKVDLTVIDRENYHLFQPLLYQVATALLQPADIAAPIRRLLFHRGHPTVYMDEVIGVDPDAKVVQTRERRVPYDILILAPGAQTSYFGNDEWADESFGLKTLDDAARLRHQLLLAFERAEMADDVEERRRLTTIAVVGGGPNGVSTAVAIADLVRKVLARDFRNIDPSAARLMLVETDERVLPGFPDKLRRYAQRILEKKGVELHLGVRCEGIEDHALLIGDERFHAGTIVWLAGLESPQIPQWLDAPSDKKGRIDVREDLTVPGLDEVYVIGDAALVQSADGAPLPGLAAVAKQQGRYVAGRIRAQLQGKPPQSSFRYRDYGTLVPLGGGAAVGLLGRVQLTGFPAWVVWAVAHLAFLTDARRRFVVGLNWLWAYTARRRGARIIENRAGTDTAVVERPAGAGKRAGSGSDG